MWRILRAFILAATSQLVCAGAVAVWPIGTPIKLDTAEANARRGAYLARASGCIACHSDTAKDRQPLAGGTKFETPFGTLFAPNVTTDADYGIGAWTPEDFARAVRQGISPNGSAYYPAFPYAFYARFTDQQIADLWAAFQTVPPVQTPSKPHEMSFPFDQRWGLKLWRAAFLRPPPSDPIPDKDEEWNRGRELVEGAAHCGACHTPRNVFGARGTGTAHFAGNPSLPGGGKVPAIDTDGLKKAKWTVDSLVFALKSGIKPNGDAFRGSMGEVVTKTTSFLTNADLNAIATYLLDEPPLPTE